MSPVAFASISIWWEPWKLNDEIDLVPLDLIEILLIGFMGLNSVDLNDGHTYALGHDFLLKY